MSEFLKRACRRRSAQEQRRCGALQHSRSMHMLSPGSSIVYRNLIGKKLVVAEFGTTFFLQAGQIQPDRFGGFSPTALLRLRLTSPYCPPNMSSQCPRPPNPWGRRSPITASSARSGAAVWVWCTRRKTSSLVAMSP